MQSDLTARVYAVCDPGSVDFCCAFEDLTDLETEIAVRLDQEAEPHYAGANANKADLRALLAVVQLQVLFCKFDTALGERRYEACGQSYRKAKEIVNQHLLCKDAGGPVPILSHIARLLDVQFRQRGVLFSSRMERGFHSIFSFLPNTICIATERNKQVWEGLRTMGLLDAKARWLTEKIHKFVLIPLFVEHRRKKLSARIFKPHDEVIVWSFVDDHERLEEGEDGLDFLLGILGSMIGYLRDFVADRSAVEAIGRHAWPVIVDFLRECAGDPALLTDFEAKAASLDFISASDCTLGTLAAERKTGVQARAKILEDARNWMVSQDMTTVQVSAASSSSIMSGIDKDLSGYLFSACCVSQSACKLVEKVRSSVVAGIRDPLTTKDQQALSRQLITLFLLVRPHVHRERLTTDAFSCGIFFNDCMYFAFQLTVLPFEHGASRPITWLVDFVPTLRKLGQAHLVALLKHVGAETRRRCRHLYAYLSAVSEDANYAACEAVLNASMQYLRTALSSLSAVLPKTKLLVAITSMLTEQYLEVLLRSLLVEDRVRDRAAGNGAQGQGGLHLRNSDPANDVPGAVKIGGLQQVEQFFASGDARVMGFLGQASPLASGGPGAGFGLGIPAGAAPSTPSSFLPFSPDPPPLSERASIFDKVQRQFRPPPLDANFNENAFPRATASSGPRQVEHSTLGSRNSTEEMADRNCISYLFSSVRVQIEQLKWAPGGPSVFGAGGGSTASSPVSVSSLAPKGGPGGGGSLGNGKYQTCFDVMGGLIQMLENEEMTYAEVKQNLHSALASVEANSP
ncbi:unnamed protein product [Amoebophrya sp. A25]|nr:unnamed protein product [Amoebophrya sp. A25]|eukprot:GSA25T00016542001.1